MKPSPVTACDQAEETAYADRSLSQIVPNSRGRGRDAYDGAAQLTPTSFTMERAGFA